MAVWQFKAALIPTDWVNRNQDISALFIDGSFDGTPAWAGFTRADSLSAVFNEAFARGNCWSPDLTAWGDEESNDIHLWREQGHVDEVSVRIDMRIVDQRFIETVMEIANQFELSMLLMESKKNIGTDINKLMEEAGSSRAAAFARDPVGYLKSL